MTTSSDLSFAFLGCPRAFELALAVVEAVIEAVVEAVVGPVRLRESLSVPPPAPLFSAWSPPRSKTRLYNEASSL